ncbi:MAG TPA: tetratricopeptide repeat protein [Chroococcidiopsis sp.]
MTQKIDSRQRFQKIFVIASGLMFAGSMVASTIPLFTNAQQYTITTAADDVNNTLEDQIRGYELVLKREPDNTTALEGLANAQLSSNNPQGAIAPLEKLVTLNPDNPTYANQLADAKKQVGE